MTRFFPLSEQRWTHRRCCCPGRVEKAEVRSKRQALLPPIQIPTVKMTKVSNLSADRWFISCSSYHSMPLINRPGIFWSLLATYCRDSFHLLQELQGFVSNMLVSGFKRHSTWGKNLAVKGEPLLFEGKKSGNWLYFVDESPWILLRWRCILLYLTLNHYICRILPERCVLSYLQLKAKGNAAFMGVCQVIQVILPK